MVSCKAVLCTNLLPVLLVFGALLFAAGICDGAKLKIGAIFDTENEFKERAFHLAIKNISGTLVVNNTEIEAIVEYITLNNSFSAMTAACSLIEQGVVAILGPSGDDNANVVQSVCDNKDIPLLDVRWDPNPLDRINFYPYQATLTQAYIDLVRAWNFKNFVILYEDNNSLVRVGELLRLYEESFNIMIRQLDKTRSGDYRTTLKEVWRSGATHFLIDCSIEILGEVLKQAQQIGLMTNKEHYIITNLDLDTLDLTSYQYSETNITGMRLVDPDREAVRDVAYEVFRTEAPESQEFTFRYVAAWRLQLQTALVYDAIMVFGEVLKEPPKDFEPPSLSCQSKKIWQFGATLVNSVKHMRYPGLTGLVNFGPTGYRSELNIEIIEVMEGGIAKVGNWSSSGGTNRLNVSRSVHRKEGQIEGSLFNKTFTVMTALTVPYGFRKNSASPLYGNDEYEGFAIDLIDELSKKLGFNYTIIIKADSKNGNLMEDKVTWEGMIGDVMYGVADVAVADLTITTDREDVVDFTTPFMNLGISILFQKPKKAAPGFFTFADPFALDVWKLLAASFVGVSLILFILGRICASEWTNPYPCVENPEFLENQLSLRNCFWFSTGSLMQQGSEIAPIAISTRMVAGMWWFFTLIMVSSYTANLAAFLTTESPDILFSNVGELVENAEIKGIKYGAKKDGATEAFFKNSQDDKYRKVWSYMQKNYNAVMYKENDHGVLRTENDTYAFFMENTSIEYEIQRRCNLTKVGNLLDEKGYGIALPKNSTYRNDFNTAILEMQRSGKMDELKRKWWEEKRGGGQCSGDDKGAAAQALNWKNVGGVFYVTLGGTVLSCIFVFIEMPMHMMKISIKTKAPLRKLLQEEFKFYFNFSGGTVKPVLYATGSEDNSNQSADGEIAYNPAENENDNVCL